MVERLFLGGEGFGDVWGLFVWGRTEVRVSVFLMVNDACDIGNGRVNGGNFFLELLRFKT